MTKIFLWLDKYFALRFSFIKFLAYKTVPIYRRIRKKASIYLKKQKKMRGFTAHLFCLLQEGELVASSDSKALAAIYSLTLGGVERNLAFLTAVCTNSREHLSCALCTVLAGITACLASLGLVLEALLCIEFLLTGGEHEIVAAILALECLVLVHVSYLALKWMFFCP
jgi:hypothetical protein